MTASPPGATNRCSHLKSRCVKVGGSWGSRSCRSCARPRIALLAVVELGEYAPALCCVQGIVAQHVALARTVANGRDGVLAGLDLIWRYPTRRVGARDHVARVARIGQAHELREVRIQRRDLDLHAPGWDMSH